MRPLPVSPTNNGIRIGAKLRAARKAHGYTLDQLALSAGLTKGFLSRVERDETSLSVASLITLCEVMSLDVGSLFAVPEVALVRRETAPTIDLGGTGVNERLMTPRGQPRLQVVHTTAQPGGSGGDELYTISCELEVLYVLKGSVDLILSDRRQRLTAGDALTFAGGEPHTWVNASATRPAEMVWVLVPAPWSGST
jgi:transcriptional regulator with XRE-family HTH domain